jgi:uncharacterized SAM-binding protein YcdF (DUF218 family)
MKKVRLARYIIVILGMLVAFWLIGMILFVQKIKSSSDTQLDTQNGVTDAIVVLTGGSERLGAGLDLLKSGKAKKLFISGVHPGLTLDRMPVDKELYACCVVLGHEAESTMGNAEETKNWMEQEGYHSLQLVTANYHMPRSLLFFNAEMPDIKIIPYPVQPDSVKLKSWWAHSGTANLLVTEYNKFLWAYIRLSVR